jgi:hypothetical protein
MQNAELVGNRLYCDGSFDGMLSFSWRNDGINLFLTLHSAKCRILSTRALHQKLSPIAHYFRIRDR